MAYRFDKSSGDIIIDSWEKGIAVSPLKGIANMQAVNIATETGEVMCSFNRVAQTQTSITGTFTISGSTTLITTNLTGTLLAGSWITMTSNGITGLTNGTSYYVLNVSGNTVQLSTAFSQSSLSAISYSTGSTATFTTANYLFAKPVTSCTESYNTSSGIEYRYYILDVNGHVWVNDSFSGNYSSVPIPAWALIDTNSGVNVAGATGLSVLNGWLFIFSNKIYARPTIALSNPWTIFAGGQTVMAFGSFTHYAFTGQQSYLYYTDGRYIGTIYANSGLPINGLNIQSNCSYTSTGTSTSAVGTITNIFSGTLPTSSSTANIATVRVPAYFYNDGLPGSSNPSALTAGTTYYIDYTAGLTTPLNFKVYAGATGGSVLDSTSGAVGTQYFNTFYPVSVGGITTMIYTPIALILPDFEITQSLAEIGTNILIGTMSNALYLWDGVNTYNTTPIYLPENNVVQILTVNNMGYIFAGNKGNIYITNGSAASAVITVPDYTAGIPGNPASYIEPYFTWGGAMYLRGRVYFSVSSSNSNCGGIWSFIPTQNMFFGEDYGLALRIENQASYGTYNGYSPVLIASQTQGAIAPQYWNAWESTTAGTSYGIDFTGTTTGTVANIETDLIPVGTMLNKKTLQQIEYKLSTPLAVGESVAISYRQNSTGSYTSCGTAIVESTTGLSGYFTANFEKSQWLQLNVVLTPLSTSSSTFVRLTEIRIR